MNTKRVTSSDVAERAGVSRTTVSFVLNNTEGKNITDATRQRVLRAARELGYVPDAAARTLASGQTQTLGLIICHSKHIRVDAYIPRVLYALNEVSREHGFRLLLETVEDVSLPDAYMGLVRSKQIDGLIVLNPRSDDTQLLQLIEERYPVVVLGPPEHPDGHYVTYDDLSSAQEAVSHLIELGHTRIAMINYAPDRYIAANRRIQGYARALESADIPVDDAFIRPGDYSAESGYTAMQSLLEMDPLPTALFAGNDTIAIGALAAIHERGLRVPEDIAVAGYDDIPNARFLTPPLTTVRISAAKQGRFGGEMLIRLIKGEEPEQRHVVLESELIVRESCGASRRKNVRIR